MPEWFKTLGFVTLTLIMVVFLVCFVSMMVAVCVTVYREWKQDIKRRKE